MLLHSTVGMLLLNEVVTIRYAQKDEQAGSTVTLQTRDRKV